MNIDPQQAIAQLSNEFRASDARDTSRPIWVFNPEVNALIATSDCCVVPLGDYGELRFKTIAPIRRRFSVRHYNHYNILHGQVAFRFSRPNERGSAWLWFVRDDGKPNMVGTIVISANDDEYDIISPFQARGDR